ncbi:hypothetical protein DSECCO2_416580 [anaerobic digester metagenome]
MPLRGRPAGQAVLHGELHQVSLLNLAPLHRQSRDHLIVRQRHVARACRLGDVGILHLGGIFVDIGDFQTCPIQRRGDKAGNDRLRRGAGTHTVAAQQVQIDFGVHTVVPGHHHSKAADHILQNGQAFFHMILAVHPQLGGAAASGDHHGLIRAGGDQRRGLNHGVGRSGAEAPAVRAGGAHQAGDLRGGLGKVAAAPLVHIAAGLLRAVDDIFHFVLVNARIFHSGQQRQNGGCLGHQIFVHHMGREIHVDVMGAVHAAHQLVVVVKALGVFFAHQPGNFRSVHTVVDPGHDRLVHQGVGGKSRLVRCHKVLVQFYQIKHVAALHQQQKFLLRHDLSELAVPRVHVADLVVPRLLHGGKLVGRFVANVHLIGPIGEGLFKAAEVTGQLLEVFAVGIDDPLGGLRGAVAQHHIGRMDQNVARAFDDTLHEKYRPLCVSK